MGDDDLQSPADAGEALSPEAEASDPWIGQALAGYEIQRRIGEGGMGIVYLARHQSLNRSAAVKFLGAHMVTDKAYIERFLHEAQGAAKLNHPNIVQVYDAGSMGEDVFYFIMEYIEGTDLGILLRENKILPVQDSVGYIRQACSALNYAHRNGIIHRDVKPDNLMLTADGTIKLGDLGLAKWTTDEGSGGMTQTGIVMGTPFYISPEQVRGSRDVDSRADIYSLGASLFHMVTSKIPYEGPSPAVIMAMHLNNSVPEPHKVNPALDRDICAIIKKLMAKKPDERYQTMQEVDVVLAEYQSRKSHPSQLLGQAGSLGGAAPESGQGRGAYPTGYTRWRSLRAESDSGSPAKMWLIVGLSVLIGAVFMAAFVTWFTRSQRETDPHPQQSPAPVSAPVQPVEPAVEEPPSAPETPEIDEVDAPPEPLAADTAVETEPVPIP